MPQPLRIIRSQPEPRDTMYGKHIARRLLDRAVPFWLDTTLIVRLLWPPLSLPV